MKAQIVTAFIMILIVSLSCRKYEKNEFIDNTDKEVRLYKDPRDNQQYKIKKIGSKYWMLENLKYETDTGCWNYKNNAENSKIYGKLYSWKVACDICPEGWRLPSEQDWQDLERHIGMTYNEVNNFGWRGSKEGGKLKYTDTLYWSYPNALASDEYSFGALPAGYMEIDTTFVYLRNHAYFWSKTECDNLNSYYRQLSSGLGKIFKGCTDKKRAFSVRCIID